MNRLCRLLGIKVPIILGGMGNISNAALAAAVSEAGGLGTIGAGIRTPEEVEKLILEVKERTIQPFALNIPIMVSPFTKEIAELAVNHQVPVVSLSAGNPEKLIPFFHKHHIKVMVVVGSVKHGLKAMEAGADCIVGEGYEAAGINSPFESTTLTLIPQLVDAVSIPVLAAGGIADGRGLAAAFALGAEGVQMGTRFIAAMEAPFSKAYKEKVLSASDVSTTVVGRSKGRIRRVLKGPYVERLLELESQGITDQDFNALTSEDAHCKGALDGNDQQGFMNSGQVAGLIKSEETVQDIIDGMMQDAREVIGKISKSFLA